MYDKLRRSHMTLSVLRQHLPAIGAKRVILTHLSEDMLSHIADVELECAVDGLVVEF
jgi:ribonuclease BN (tRNA processing enzyme)